MKFECKVAFPVTFTMEIDDEKLTEAWSTAGTYYEIQDEILNRANKLLVTAIKSTTKYDEHPLITNMRFNAWIDYHSEVVINRECKDTLNFVHD